MQWKPFPLAARQLKRWRGGRSPNPQFDVEGPPALFRSAETQWLGQVQLSAATIGSLAQAAPTVEQVLQTLSQLEADAYLEFMLAYYRSGLRKFGAHWHYADLLTVLHAAASLLQPARYLEIGVRRGRSMAIVAQAAPRCELVGFDLWVANYAGMPNPGPELVRSELNKFPHQAALNLISGDSHETVPQYLRQHPQVMFDLINVDGDHSEAGARADLETVLPRLSPGGVLVLDDIVHPQHEYLETIWDELVESDRRFSTFKCRDLGYGVAVAVRKE